MNLDVLIDEVEKRKPLWDFTLKEYKSREITAQHWNEIGNIFNASSEIVKKKWKSLRDNFRAELKKSKVLLKEGVTKDTAVKTSKWLYFNRMSFLTDVMVNEKSPWKINDSVKSESVSEKQDSDPDDVENCTDDVKTEYTDNNDNNHTDYNFDSDPDNDNDNDNDLSLSPHKKICIIRPEDTYSSQIKFLNDSDDVTSNSVDFTHEFQSDNVIVANSPTSIVYEKNQNYNFLISFLPYMDGMSEMQNLKFRCKMSHVLMECLNDTSIEDQSQKLEKSDSDNNMLQD